MIIPAILRNIHRVSKLIWVNCNHRKPVHITGYHSMVIPSLYRNVQRVYKSSWLNNLNSTFPKVLSSFNTPAPKRTYASCPSSGMKVTVLGAGGCTGQPLSLLLKQCPQIDVLALYDQVATCGFGIELSHVDTKTRVKAYSGRHMLCQALCDAKVVVIVARDTCDTFEKNAPILVELSLQLCNMCPAAFVIVATEPVESMVPILGEIQRLRNCYNPRRLMGCVELNFIRANTILADFLRVPPESVHVPVVGGASSTTMVPVLSASVHPNILSHSQVECLTSSIMTGNEAVRDAKESCVATPCYSGAFAIARTTINVVKALQGKRIVQSAYCDHLGTCAPCCQYFSSQVILGPGGIETLLGVPQLTPFEHCLLCNSLPYVRNEILRAQTLVYNLCMRCCKSPLPVHPCVCYSQTCVPCVAPINWTCDWPDPIRDAYIASICRDMKCKCAPCTVLTWTDPDPYEHVGNLEKTVDKVPVNNYEVCPGQAFPKGIRFEVMHRTGDCCPNPGPNICQKTCKAVPYSCRPGGCPCTC